MKKAGSNLLFNIGWLLVFVSTATCTVLLFRRFSPSDAPWLPYTALAAFEYGVINWLHFHKHKARGPWQMVISMAMTIISGLAICAATVLELLLLLSSKGLETLPVWTQQVTLFALVGQIGLNVLAFIGISLTDPDHIAKLMSMEAAAPLPTASQSVTEKTHVSIEAVRRVLDRLSADEMEWLAQRLQQPTQHVAQLPGGATADPLLSRLMSEKINHQASENGRRPQGE